jgi:hypothetical protein
MNSVSSLTAAGVGRRARRTLVLSAYSGYLAVVGVFWLRSALDWPGWTLWFASVPALVTLFSYFVLMLSSGAVAHASDRHLDERQQLVRNRAYTLAYQIVGGLFLILTLLTLIALNNGTDWLPRSLNEFNAVFWGLWLLTTTLPTAVLAWTEPDISE